MFLATTGLKEFWDDREEVLFLGSWCLQEKLRGNRERIQGRVLPSPWEDRERFHRAAEYLDHLSERSLERLTAYLNEIHGTALTTRYWRILIGPWLMHYLHVAYDRYVHLRDAIDRHPRFRTIVLDPSSFHVVRDTTEYMDLMLDDPYNLQIISQLLTGMGLSFPQRDLPNRWWTTPAPGSSRTRPGRRTLRASIGQLRNRFSLGGGESRPIAFFHTTLDRRILSKLVRSIGPTASTLELGPLNSWPSAAPLFDSRRLELGKLQGSDEFDRIFLKGLPHVFPTCFLEGYTALRERTLHHAPSRPQVIVSAVGWYLHESFKLAAAEWAERGTRLIGLQHGGGYGMHRSMPQELHERRICDSYLVWGWANGEEGHRIKNAPAPQISHLAEQRLALPQESGRKILFVATTNPRYLHRFNSMPHGTLLGNYFLWQKRFLKALPDELQREVLFQPHPEEYGHGVREQLSQEFPSLQWTRRFPFHRNLQDSRLLVIDHSGTPLLEALAANIPLLLFWNPEHWQIRTDAVPYFEELRDAGILLDSPEAAANGAAERYVNPRSWWQTPRVQQARGRFVERYALWRSDWEQEWASTLQQELGP